MSDISFTVTDTFALGLIDTLVFDGGGLSFVLFVLQILSFLPPDLQRTHRDVSAATKSGVLNLFSSVYFEKKTEKHTNLSFSGIAFHTSANFLLSSPNTAEKTQQTYRHHSYFGEFFKGTISQAVS